ncbi:MAG: J domain-containing protein [Ottowia sp.]|uniref:J domain-containing protein n=1 Tax=Ottowia sp. TaxID=1898956 RepID=UPI0039E34836
MTSAYAERGLPDAATEREVRAAWRRLASRWHPDRNPSAEAMGRMQRINRAFNALRAWQRQMAAWRKRMAASWAGGVADAGASS